VRFATLILVVTASTFAIFGYLWQLSRPDLEARTRMCLRGFSSGPLARLIAQLTKGASTRAVASAACVRPDTPALTAWSLTGIGILAAVSLALYLLTPWWIIKVGWPGSGPLKQLDPKKTPRVVTFLEGLADEVGLARCPVFYVNWAGRNFGEARAFGYRRWPCVRLNAGLLVSIEAQVMEAERAGPRAEQARPGKGQATACDVLLHELAHLRNKDNLPTYLTLAASRAFVVLIPAAYLVMLAVSGVRPVNPGARIVVTAALLMALVALSTRAVLRSRELHADATAAHFRRIASLDPPPVLSQAAPVLPKPLASGWRRARSYHPGPDQRAAALSWPERLYRPDPLALATAGVAVAIIASEVTPALFSSVLGPLLRPGSSLLAGTGAHPLLLILLTYGPAALVTSVLVVALATATARRREHLASRAGTGGPTSQVAWLALPMVAGMLVGIPLSFDYVIAGTWGVFDTSVTRNLIVAGMSAAVLAVILLVVFRWASESARVWFTAAPRRPRLAHAAMLVTGTLGVAPAILAWSATSGLPLVIQLLVGADRGQRPYIGRWPAVTAVSTHVTALGAFDIVPGAGFLLALPCLFVAARSLSATAPRPGFAGGAGSGPRIPVSSVLTTGLTAAGISAAAGLVLMLSLHAAIGTAQFAGAGGFGLLYLNRAVQLVVAACAGLGAAWSARRAGGTRLTSGILTALITAGAAAVLAPKLLFVGELGWGYSHVNPAAYPVLYGIVGNMTPGKAVASALILVTVSGAASRLAARRATGHARARAAPGPRADAACRLAAALGFAALLTGLTLAGFYYFTRGFS